MCRHVDATNQDRRSNTCPEPKFTVDNPNVRLSQQAIEALARLLLATNLETATVTPKVAA
jgi:hypothetical protein